MSQEIKHLKNASYGRPVTWLDKVKMKAPINDANGNQKSAKNMQISSTR